MDGPIKELEKLKASTENSAKGKIPAVDSSLDSLLQSLYEVKSRIAAGSVTQDTFALLSQTVDSKKKEVEEKQREVYNAIARLGKALDKVGLVASARSDNLSLSRNSRSPCLLMIPSSRLMLPKRHLIARSPCTSFAPANSPQQRLLSKYVHLSLANMLATHPTQESGVEITPEQRGQFMELHRIITALRRQDVGPALE